MNLLSHSVGGDLKPILVLIHDGESFDAGADIARGASRYLVAFPADRRCFGLTVRITSFADRLTEYRAEATRVCDTSDEAFREMNVSEVHRLVASGLGNALEPWISVVREGASGSDGTRTSRYVIMFPVLKRSLGLVVRYRDRWLRKRQYEPVRVTDLTADADTIMRQMAG